MSQLPSESLLAQPALTLAVWRTDHARRQEKVADARVERRLREFGSWPVVLVDLIVLLAIEVTLSIVLLVAAMAIIAIHDGSFSGRASASAALRHLPQSAADWSLSPLGLAAGAAITQLGMLLVLYWRLLRPRILDWQGLGFGASLRRRPLRAFTAGLVLGLVALLAGGVVVQCLQWLGLNTSGQQNALKSVQHAPAALFVPFALTAGVTAPLAEEIFFRGYVFRALAVRYGMPVGVAASSICFGALHLLGGVTWEVAGLVVIGAILAYGYAATGNMVTNITAHMVNNVVGLILLYNH